MSTKKTKVKVKDLQPKKDARGGGVRTSAFGGSVASGGGSAASGGGASASGGGASASTNLNAD